MGRLRSSARELSVILVVMLSSGCGGGSAAIQTQTPPPPPPAQDFSVAFSAATVSVQQAGTSSAVKLSVTPVNGFSGSVQVSLSGLPSGVASNPVSPFSIATGGSTSVLFSAASTTATGTFTITATGSAGSLSHTATLTLTIQSGVTGSNLPRTAYARTDSVPAFDDPSGEPHHRHLVYDPAQQLVFVANRAMNRVEVFSSTNGTRVSEISVPGASSADLSIDGSTVWVGTATEQIAAIDTTALQVKTFYEMSGLLPLPNTLFDRPEELLALSSGNVMMRLRQSQTSEALLALWNPSTNALTNLTTTAPQLFQSGLGAMARSGDQTKVLVAANDSSGQIAIYDASGNVLAGPQSLGAGTIPLVAANPSGTRFAAVFVSNGATQVLLFDASFHQTGTYTTAAVNGMVFSRDGEYLYVSENAGAPPVITALDGNSLNFIGQVPDLWLAGKRSEIEDIDTTGLIFAVANRGVSFLDAASPTSLPASVPVFSAAPAAQPSEGPNAGGTAVTITGQSFEASTQLAFRTQLAANASVASPTQINATSPANTASGSVNLTAYFPSGWLALAPGAFSYGPQILQILPNAGSQSGGDTVQIYGYGFGTTASQISVSVGTTAAPVQSAQNLTTIAPTLGLDPTYPFSLECITVQTPAGAAGKADVSITSPAGSITASKSFQYLQSENFYAKPALEKFILYDQGRQWLYLSNIDHVDVFDLTQNTFHSTSLEPPGGPPPSAELRGLALTPDNTQLIAADFGSQNIYLFDPDSGSGSTVNVGGVTGYADSGPARVAATSTQNVFVGLSAESGTSGACTSCLGEIDLATSSPSIEAATEPEIASLEGAPLVQSNGNGNQVFVAYSTAPGGTLATWNASSPNDFATFTANDSASDLGASTDGNTFALSANGTTEIRNTAFSLTAVPTNPELTQIPGRNQVPGINIHPSGALIYQPFLTGPAGNAGVKGGIDILDAHSGTLRLRIVLPQQLMTDVDGMHGSFLAIDQNGQQLFAITSTDGSAYNAGVTIIDLANVPLGIGTLTPANGSAAGGTQITLRGSGFLTNTAVSIGGKPAAVTFVDINTLSVVTPAVAAGPQRITVTNPDGETVSLDAAFTAN
jgi:IPT/TIG domain